MLVNQGKVVRSQLNFERTLVRIGRTRGRVDEPILDRENNSECDVGSKNSETSLRRLPGFSTFGPGFSAEDLHCASGGASVGVKKNHAYYS